MKVKELKQYLSEFQDDAQVGIFEGYLEVCRVNPRERKRTYLLRDIQGVTKHEDPSNNQCIIVTELF